MSPGPAADGRGRTKHPPALTIKFATFSRKTTPGMMAVGGLPAQMVLHMLVSTRVPPQYGEASPGAGSRASFPPPPPDTTASSQPRSLGTSSAAPGRERVDTLTEP